jgi:hypothetical protein
MSHTILTFIATVAPGRQADLEALLAQLEPDPAGNAVLPLGQLDRLHFASLVVIPPDDPYPAALVFENNFDGPLEAYLEDLLTRVGPGLHRIFGHCVGYSGAGPLDAATLRAFLQVHVVRPNAYHVGNPGRTLARIRQELDLRDRLQLFLDELVPAGAPLPPPAEIRQRIQQFVSANAPWAASVGPRLTLAERVVPWLKIAAAAAVVLPFVPLVGPIWTVILRWKEMQDEVQQQPPPHEHLESLLNRENRTHIVQNHMANVTRVKAGLFRRATLWGVLALVNLVARTATRGELSGIPSIHFAHWSMIDGGRRLLFLTNYDGSWENYLDDFIDKASTGLTAIWTNTEGFPKTEFLALRGGSRDGARFKAIARDKQVYSNVWYSAYPTLTVQGIDKNSVTVEQLNTPMEDAAVRQWLWRF